MFITIAHPTALHKEILLSVWSSDLVFTMSKNINEGMKFEVFTLVKVYVTLFWVTIQLCHRQSSVFQKTQISLCRLQWSLHFTQKRDQWHISVNTIKTTTALRALHSWLWSTLKLSTNQSCNPHINYVLRSQFSYPLLWSRQHIHLKTEAINVAHYTIL